jgi:hypothetical protein
MRMTYQNARLIASHYESTKASIGKLASEFGCAERLMRQALRMCGVDLAREHTAWKCCGCGRRYTHRYCHVCRRSWCEPVKLRRRPWSDSEPNTREYAVEWRGKVTVLAAK